MARYQDIDRRSRVIPVAAVTRTEEEEGSIPTEEELNEERATASHGPARDDLEFVASPLQRIGDLDESSLPGCRGHP